MWLLIISAMLSLVIIYIVFVLFGESSTSGKGTSLEAFIVESDGRDEKPSKKTSATNKYNKVYSVPGRQILILYGTEYGFSEEVAQTLYDRLTAVNIDDGDEGPLQPRLVNMKFYQQVDWKEEQLILVLISTAGDGVPPTDAREFYSSVMTDSVPVTHTKFAVLGMGDSNYPHFCKAGRTLDQRFEHLGSERLVSCGDVDMEDWTVINTWMNDVIRSLDDVNILCKLDYLQLVTSDGEEYQRSKPFMATLKVKRELTVRVTKDDKETIHLEFSLKDSGLSWTAGDALGIYPTNNPLEVKVMLQALGCHGDEQVDVPRWAYHPQPDSLTLETALLKYYDLKQVKPELLQLLRDCLSPSDLQTRLDKILAAGASKTNMILHQYLAVREVGDVLQEFSSSGLSHQRVLENMKALMPRYYSISSSPYVDSDTACVTAAVVRYKTLGKSRTGVTTTFLQDRLNIDQSCPVFISRNPDFRLPGNGDVPIIMIGPGTGLAPFRAFIQERVLQKSRGENILYFCCRSKDKDYLYKTELESWDKDGHITLRVAFSRDQAEKVYVQHLLTKDDDLIWKLIDKEGAHIYVCGDAQHMAHDVHKAFVDIIQERGSRSREEAILYLQKLENEDRYQKDVWVT